MANEAIAETELESCITKEQAATIEKALLACIDIGVFLDRREAWEWIKNQSGVASLAKISEKDYEPILARLRTRYANVPSSRIQQEEIARLLASLVRLGVYRSPVESHQEFIKTFGNDEKKLTRIQARKAIAALTKMSEDKLKSA